MVERRREERPVEIGCQLVNAGVKDKERGLQQEEANVKDMGKFFWGETGSKGGKEGRSSSLVISALHSLGTGQ